MGISRKIFTLANQITMIRMCFIIPILLLMNWPNRWAYLAAGILFIIASLTDWLDGHIARKENMVTSFGKFLDPLADKLLICSVLIMFVELQWVPAWITVTIVIRELAVTGLRAMAIDENVVMGADIFGKLKTVTQILAIIPLLIHYPLWGIDLVYLGTFLLYIALILTVFSGMNYFYSFYTLWQKGHADEV